MEQELPGKPFREFLRSELTNRAKNNPNYSLRSFARYLGISASGLSSVMSGKAPVSLRIIQKVSKKLSLPASAAQQFQMDLLSEKIKGDFALKNFEIIEPERFALIKDWYHYAILNLIRTKGFKSQLSWIAKRLGITLGQTQSAVERLKAAELLNTENDQWTELSNKFTSHTNNKHFSEAKKENQIQLFTLALESISEISFEERNHTGTTIAINKKDLPRAKEFITKFRTEFMNQFDQTENADEVYHLGVALFPIKKNKN
jgi:transcriptional regulator with XRE-family HTH domain